MGKYKSMGVSGDRDGGGRGGGRGGRGGGRGRYRKTLNGNYIKQGGDGGGPGGADDQRPQLAQQKKDDGLEGGLGWPLFTEGPDRLGWLLNFTTVRAGAAWLRWRRRARPGRGAAAARPSLVRFAFPPNHAEPPSPHAPPPPPPPPPPGVPRGQGQRAGGERSGLLLHVPGRLHVQGARAARALLLPAGQGEA
jgi:hypothetical protein